MRPRFSVVIPVRDRADVIGRAVASVLAQTFAGVEVLVVDDGSSDDSVAAARAVSDGRVRIVRQAPAGVEAARRSGALRAHGQFIAVLDPDDEVAPGWLARLGRLIDANDAVLVTCGGEQLHADGSATIVTPGPVGDPGDRVLACFRPGAFIVRRDLLRSVGSFGGADGTDSLSRTGQRLVHAALDRDEALVATPEALVRWNEPAGESSASGELLRLRWALQSLDALARTPIPDADLIVRSATIGAIAAVRLGDHREARRLFALARGIRPDVPRLWARWLVSCVPPLAARVWAADLDQEQPEDRPEVDRVEDSTGVEDSGSPEDSISVEDGASLSAEPAQ